MHRWIGHGLLAVAVTACGQAALLLDEGQCFDDPAEPTDVVRSVEVVDCAEPHDNEVYAVVPYPDQGEYPGDETVQAFANDTCIREFEAFVGYDYLDSQLDLGYFWPTDESWDTGDRNVQCFVYELNGSRVVGSLAGAGR